MLLAFAGVIVMVLSLVQEVTDPITSTNIRSCASYILSSHFLTASCSHCKSGLSYRTTPHDAFSYLALGPGCPLRPFQCSPCSRLSKTTQRVYNCTDEYWKQKATLWTRGYAIGFLEGTRSQLKYFFCIYLTFRSTTSQYPPTWPPLQPLPHSKDLWQPTQSSMTQSIFVSSPSRRSYTCVRNANWKRRPRQLMNLERCENVRPNGNARFKSARQP